jgi:hypothetical protein
MHIKILHFFFLLQNLRIVSNKTKKHIRDKNKSSEQIQYNNIFMLVQKNITKLASF